MNNKITSNSSELQRSLLGRDFQDQILPERLRKSIQDQQERSEILISVIQLAIVFTFGLLYAIAPKTFSQEADFAPVPWVLALYLVFSLIRLGLAVNRKLPDWMLYLSSVADIALLMGLIWSFHLQYEQPPSFYLKAPTLLYLFIFIAIRALHFDPRFVISTGVSAAIGWVLMVVYVLVVDPSNSMITRDYVEYMTSNSVLIGAEFDKIVSILMVTGVLALALHRARGLLIESVIEGSAARDLSRFVPEEVAQKVIQSEEGAITGKGEVSECTILFTDIEGFTAISETLTPEELIEALNRYFSLIAGPISQFGGVISQFQGDAVLATFNVPKADVNHASNAVRAALEIQAMLDGVEFGEGISFNTRIGINTGSVVGGLVGSGDRVGYTVHGDNVNLTARLEQLNKDYGTRIIVSDSTLAEIPSNMFEFQELGEVQVRGLNRPIRIYTVTQDLLPPPKD
ncbi:MAG: adenylate/guanylate cyclase domain-containing protein [Gammaproteobacteria bacterium]|nr:adenylate/guanylate cyclase domain-containing protein [Gammaproteobacteria bacterium]